MRKFILAGVLAALAAALLASPALAFDHHFSLLGRQTSGHRAGHTKFVFKDKLLNPKDRQDRVGRDRGACRFKQNSHKLQCRALVHLNGKIGGFGDIRVRGNLGRGDHRINVIGGSGQFNGVAGKLLLRGQNLNRYHFDLTR